MARKRSLLSQLSRDAYLVSRTSGDAAAAQRGSKPLVKRIARRQITRAAFRLFR